jgi:hypothetical protein
MLSKTEIGTDGKKRDREREGGRETEREESLFEGIGAERW